MKTARRSTYSGNMDDGISAIDVTDAADHKHKLCL